MGSSDLTTFVQKNTMSSKQF